MVVIVLGIAAQMTLKGLIAPARIAVLQASLTAPKLISLPALVSTLGLSETFARTLSASAVSGGLIIFAFAHAPFQRAWGQIAAGIAVGLLVVGGWLATGYLGADDFNPAAVTSLTFVAPIADAVQYAMLSTGLSLNFGIAMVAGVFAGSLATALVTRRFHWEGFNSSRHMLRSIGGAALMDGSLVRGKHAQAGCLGGHLPAVFNGRLCACGNIGCAEAEAGGWAIPAIAREWPGFEQSALAGSATLGFREIFSAAEAGDAVAIALRDRCINVWSSNAVANIHAYDPEVVVVGGGVMQSAAVIIPRMQEYVNCHAWSGWGKPEVRAAALGNDAGLLGAVPLLREVIDGAKA